MKATVKLTYDSNNKLHWGVSLWIRHESRWIEQARFVFSWDALAVRKHYENGYIADPFNAPVRAGPGGQR